MEERSGMAVRFTQPYTVTVMPQSFAGVTIEYDMRPVTPEEQAEFDERQRQYNAYREKVAEHQQRALAFLKSFLTPAQHEQLVQHTYFDVVGSESKKTYRIYWGGSGNVFLMDGETRKIGYCAGPEVDMPFGDVLLSQKLMIECDEPAFLHVANATCMETGDRITSMGTIERLRHLMRRDHRR